MIPRLCMRFRLRATLDSYYREPSEGWWIGRGGENGDEYQFQPTCVGFILHVLPNVKTIQVLVDKAETARLLTRLMSSGLSQQHIDGREDWKYWATCA